MSTDTFLPSQELEVHYPESDGAPMGESAEHINWIAAILFHLQAMFHENANVSVHGDLFWYPVRGNPKIRAAPDAMVIFGRPPSLRPSYLQWLEGNIAPQVVFEVESPGNSAREMASRFDFYERYGVEEYYVYDFTRGRLYGHLRNSDGVLERIPQMQGWVSPRLGLRFELEGDELRIYHPDGRLFDMIAPALRERDKIKAERDRIKAERDRIKAERDRIKAERDGIQQARLKEKERLDRLIERMRTLGIDPDEEDPPAA